MRSFKILALVAILGLGACSTNEEVKDSDFLDQVKGKKFFSDSSFSSEKGEFNTDGKSVTLTDVPDPTEPFLFRKGNGQKFCRVYTSGISR